MRDTRTARKLSQVALAKAVGVSAQAVSQWENNKTAPEFARLNQIANILGIDVKWFVSGDSEPAFEDRIRYGDAVPIVDIREALQFGQFYVGQPVLPAGSPIVFPTYPITGRGFAIEVDSEIAQERLAETDLLIFDPNVVPTSGDFVVAIVFSDAMNPIVREYHFDEVDDCVHLLPGRSGQKQIALSLSADGPGMVIATMVEHRRFSIGIKLKLTAK